MFVPIINQPNSSLVAEPVLSRETSVASGPGAACAEVWQGLGPGLAVGAGHQEMGEKVGRRRVMLAVKEGMFQHSGTTGRV